ncbi:MAG: hypothetical protein MJZ61_06970 [Bacteroidales bacterium]|nr:hypothetical protein [Bacteroidales bacterium]
MQNTPENIRKMINQMLQACRNIEAATFVIPTAQSIDKDAVDNFYMCMTIILEAYMEIDGDHKYIFASINWDEVVRYIHILKMDFDKIDRQKLFFACRNMFPTLLEKVVDISNRFDSKSF